MTRIERNQLHGCRKGPTRTKLYKHRWLEAGNFRFIKKSNNCTTCVVKTKAMISFAVTAKLICAFVFANENCWFSHEAGQIFAAFSSSESKLETSQAYLR